jgi:hypothetical protein
MSLKNGKCTITTAVSEKERNIFLEVARNMGVPRYVLMRRLIRYVLDEKISWTELFIQYRELTAINDSYHTLKRVMRVWLEPEEYYAFTQLADEWGTTTSIIIRRSILLYVTGKIERGDIWY